jgi:Lipoprotein LpqB beta-propeller domain/Sporulation and spore germination
MRERRWGASGWAVAVGLLLVAGLAGCGGIPTSGPVHEGGGVQSQAGDQPFTRIIGQPPRPGMSAAQIVDGFLQASAAFDNDHATARLFLTPDSARTWNATAGVQVYDSSVSSEVTVTPLAGPPTGPVTVRFRAPTSGTISALGQFTSASARTTTVDFRLHKVGGQWRIAAPPPGLLLTTYDVQRAFRTYDLYFPDPTWTVLVPDQILVPVGPGLTTSLVSALLAGPSTWLSPAVRTAFPAGTKLVVDSAPIRNGVVQVDLTAAAAAAVGQQAAAMSAQLAWTLRQLVEVGGLRITVEGVPLRAPGAGDVQSASSWPSFDPDAETPNADVYFVNKGRLMVLHNLAARALPGPTGSGVVPLIQPAVSFDESVVAGLDPTGRRLFAGAVGGAGRMLPILSGGTSLTAPSFDRFGAVWTVDRTRTGPVFWAVKPGAAPAQVQVTSLPPGRVEALRIARDGARAAVVVSNGAASSVYLARVQRSGGQLQLAGFRLVDTRFVQTTGIAWSSADRLLVLSRGSAGSVLQPWVVDLSGTVDQSLGPIAAGPALVAVTASPSHPVLASSSDGALWWFNGFGWERIAAGTDPAYPG